MEFAPLTPQSLFFRNEFDWEKFVKEWFEKSQKKMSDVPYFYRNLLKKNQRTENRPDQG